MEYKTLEELKKEMGEKFDEYMYRANIELLNKIDEAVRKLEKFIDTCEFERAESIAFGDIVNGKYWMIFQSFIELVLKDLKKEKKKNNG